MHSKEPLRLTEEIIKKSHEVKCGAINEEDLQKTMKKKIDPRVYQSTPTIVQSENIDCSHILIKGPIWTKEEQLQLEKALQIFPVSYANRWEEIAKYVSTKTKIECIARYKEIALAIQNKNKK